VFEQLFYFRLQYLTLFRPKTSKPEGLQIALRTSHRKKHFRFGAHDGRANGKRQPDTGTLIQIHGEFQQSSGDRDPMELGGNAPVIFQLDYDGNSLPQIHAGCASLGLGLREVDHLQSESFRFAPLEEENGHRLAVHVE